VYDADSRQFHGRIDANNTVHPDADRSAVLYTRIAYSYAAAFSYSKDASLLPRLHAAVQVLDEHFTDSDQGGLYWMVDVKGHPSDTKKHVYAQSFGIYAYAFVYKATGDVNALNRAIALFNLIEEHAFIPEQQAYYEAFDHNWNRINDVRLGKDDAMEPRSTNTHLHLLEAYAALYAVWPNELLRARLSGLITVFLEKIYNEEQQTFTTFFDDHWNPRSNIYSYGHDIETIWLMMDAATTIADSTLLLRCQLVAQKVADTILHQGIHPEFGAVYNSGQHGKVLDTDFHWWAQAEAMVGFLQVYLFTQNQGYLDATQTIWKAIQRFIIDHEQGEWFFRVNDQGTPNLLDDKVGPWKCPYHTSRACLMVLDLTADLVKSVPESVQDSVPESK
jgi:mannobiose 2-epimerase